MEFPLKGWRFRPTDQELVGYYLFNKITASTPLPSPSPVHDFDVFGKQEPCQIWSMFRSSDDDDDPDPDPDDLYFFTKAKKTTLKGKRFNRRVGSGTWEGQDSGREIYAHIETGEAIVMGLKKRFHYVNNQCMEHDGSWIMFEYCLAGSLANCITGPDNDFVLCQIRKKIDKKKKKNRNNLVIMSCGDDDDDDDDDDDVMPPILQALPSQEEPPFPILPNDLPLVDDDGDDGDDGHNTNMLVDPLPQSTLPSPAGDDHDFHLPLPLDDHDDLVGFINEFLDC